MKEYDKLYLQGKIDERQRVQLWQEQQKKDLILGLFGIIGSFVVLLFVLL